MRLRRRYLTFNSFEDETITKSIQKIIYNNNFQFLWGWNLRGWWGSLNDINFQFLWGWNFAIITLTRLSEVTFNSFEDETRVNIYFRVWTLVPFNSFEDETGDAKRRIERRMTFNSFEDETYMAAICSENWCVVLSIPLRMKRGEYYYCTKCGQLFFQFLWGWNSEDRVAEAYKELSFQFLWGWNFIAGFIV